jgi:ferredoxin
LVFQTEWSSGVRIRIDPEACEGHARCFFLAPDLFDISDEGLAYLTPLGAEGRPEHRELAHRAAMNCPETAIVVIDDGAA